MLNFSDDELFDFISTNIPYNAVPPYASKVLIPFETFSPDDLAGMIVSKINGRENVVETTIIQAEQKLINCQKPIWYGKSEHNTPLQKTPDKNRTALNLCLLLGYFGVH